MAERDKPGSGGLPGDGARGPLLGETQVKHHEVGLIERVATLLAAARSPAAVPREHYVAAARTAFDAASSELSALEVNLVTLEAELGKSALVAPQKGNT